MKYRTDENGVGWDFVVAAIAPIGLLALICIVVDWLFR